METGTVKWFNNIKRVGFITPDVGASEFFAHFSVIEIVAYP